MQKIAMLYDASQAVLSTVDLDQVLQQILRLIRDSFQLLHAAVLLRDQRTDDLYVKAQSGSFTLRPGLRVPVGLGIVGTAVQSHQPTYAPRAAEDERYVETVPEARSELAIPLIVQDRVIGVLECISGREDAFSKESIDLLMLLSVQVSLALQKAQLRDVERQHAAQLDAINLIARQTTAVTDLTELLRQFCALLLKTFSVDHAAVLLVEEDRLVFSARAGRLSARLSEGFEMPVTAGLCGRALAQGAPVLCEDVDADPDYVTSVSEARSELCLPLISFGQPMGVLALSSAHVDGFRDFNLTSLEAMADICTVAIQNAIYFDHVRQLAYRDGLTGIFNRRFFEMRIREELERSQRYNSALSLLLLDLDGFKELNDELGHLPGDEALRQISALFVQQVRKADVVCRYGGDEFAVLLPETSGDKALAAAEKLRNVVAEWADAPRSVSVSVGIACFPENGSTRDDLVKAADDALYRAKQQGRNRVVIASRARACAAGANS